MSNDIDTQVIQKTQKVLGKFIKKPPLTDKLLRKPPFRFLHDVVSNVIRETHFLKGLYTERELVSENVKDKDDKVAFLNKLIEATKAITGKELNVRSSKVIAGLEPIETNMLLQTIGMALDKKLDSSQYITKIKSEKKNKSQINTQGSDRKIKQDKSKEKMTNKEEKKKNTSIPTPRNGIIRTSDKTKGGKTLPSKDSIESTRNEVKGKGVVKIPKEKIATPKETTINTPQQKSDIEEAVKSENGEQELKNIVNETNENKESKSEKAEGLVNISEENHIMTGKDLLQQEEDLDYTTKSKLTFDSNFEKGIEEQNIMQITAENDTTEYPATKERVKSAKSKSSILKITDDQLPELNKEMVKQRLKSAKQKNSNGSNTKLDNDAPTHLTPAQLENNLEKPSARPRSSLRPPSVRPLSARPGAPRLRNDLALPEGEVIPLGKVNVIVETYNNKEEDEEETVTMQAVTEPEYQAPMLQLPTDKGHLVEQILEQIHQDDIIEHTKPAIIEWEQDGFRSRNIANKEIEQLKTAIQTLTRTANPLGKLVNYLHEDIEAMHNELDVWVNSARQIMVDVTNQKRINNDSNKPLQAQLEDIEDNIVKHQQQIIAVHGNILRNEQRIRDLLIK